MPSVKRSSHFTPAIFEAGNEVLGLNSVLADLTLHQFQVEVDCTVCQITQVFEQYPALPGVVLRQQGKFWGMISRHQLLELLINPHLGELFASQPLVSAFRHAMTDPLILASETPILVGAQTALRRSPHQQRDPVVVIRNRNKTHSGQRSSVQTDYLLLDIHELNVAYWQIRGIETQVRYERMQTQMIQTEKMANLGRLVDGVAHEILDPVGFIWGNLVHLSSYTQQLLALLDAYEQQFPQRSAAIEALRDEIELDYLRQDLPQTLASIQTGADRLKKLALSLQNFCHIDEIHPKPTNLHECLDSIVLLLKSRLTGEIEFIRAYGSLPPITCYAGQLNQVFINILTNAVTVLLNQAVRQELTREWNLQAKEQQPLLAKPQITITTEVRDYRAEEGSTASSQRWVSIRIANNGESLSPEQQQQILDSFSIERRTTKETSLAVSYQIVTAKHGGRFYLRSPLTPAFPPQTEASGTEFEILLPLI